MCVCVSVCCTDPYTPALEGAPLFSQSTDASTQTTTDVEGGTTYNMKRRSAKTEFPVIVFAHGMGGMRTMSSGICCDLASHGYVVTAVEHRSEFTMHCYYLYTLYGTIYMEVKFGEVFN